MSETIDQGQLEALLAAVTEGTLEQPQPQQHVTPSAVSQRIKALETRVGRVLRVHHLPTRRADAVGRRPAAAARRCRRSRPTRSGWNYLWEICPVLHSWFHEGMDAEPCQR